ncbi:MAG: type II toxin-antitoxin system RelE/ParE family toxin [Gammaproteobacteria bacterium]|nr:type II toxin-antitoxin system RelE/ParE family toxin [Gammaproteobacteria bacterium]
MARRLIWSVAAADDLQSIAEYIERDSPHYAAAVVSKIVTLARSLPRHPRLGRVVPEFGRDDVRERFVYSYRVIYQVRDEVLVVVNVIHGRRLYEPDGAALPGASGDQ